MTPDQEGYTYSPSAERRRRALRQQRFVRRRTVAVLVMLVLLAGLYLGFRWLSGRFAVGTSGGQPDLPSGAPVTTLSFKPETLLPAGDLNSDGVAEQVALGPVKGDKRPVALVTGSKSSLKQVGEALDVAALPLAVTDLNRAKGVLVQMARHPAAGEPTKVTLPGGQAVEAFGGEPYFQAWRLDLSRGLVPADYYELAAPVTPSMPTMIMVDKWLNVLWFYEEGKLTMTARVATGKFVDGPMPTAQNQAVNLVTPLGTYSISHLDPNPGYWKDNIPGGDPRNPLGTRWLGFSVYEGDRSLVWGIHGTNEPDSIGRWASNGCIRVGKSDLERLFARVKMGTPLQIVSTAPRL